MPEYLAPGVYVEEIEIGAKPIEGVSTSTAGFLGYTERGPLNKPTLVTSFADFERNFGGFLPAIKGDDDLSKIRWLAYAVKGFFENGGKRAFITRVADSTAAAAYGALPKIADPGDQNPLEENAFANETGLKMKNNLSFNAGDVLLLKQGAQSEYLEYQGKAKKISLDGTTLEKAYPAGTDVMKGAKKGNPITKIKVAVLGDQTEISLKSTDDIEKGMYLLIDDSTNNEIVKVVEVDEDNSSITIEKGLLNGHAVDKELFEFEFTKEANLVRNAAVQAPGFYVNASTNIIANNFVKIGEEYHRVASGTQDDKACVVSPELKYDHTAGKDLVKLEPAVEVEASSEGTWGDSIKVCVKPGSLCTTKLTEDVSNPNHLDLETVNGIEPGSILRVPTDSSSQYVTVEEVHKTSTGNFVLVDTQVTLSAGVEISSEEFDLFITDGKNEEVFKHLSLNEEHSRYIKKIVTKKSSGLIRIGDTVSTGAIAMPTPDDMPGWLLSGGNDGFPPADDDKINTIYEGQDSTEPDDRTGLYTFKNVDEINIAAIPGITSKYLQEKLVTHCEIEMKDRFAVLDPEVSANLDRIKEQRNYYDSSYAAIYYPWLYTFDPLSKDYINIPPSGCVCGVYARTDVTRGVHKAPANEKVNGVFGLEKLNGKFRIVNKGTQEILNPLGINCIRQFPGRGIRVWGGRTISSNTLWKYVNVRRLFLYIEESIEAGTQWVVFEPNDEKLWARVIQTIRQFLTRVWKDGALMGSTPEEAFFIKCDRTTMTQTDIDSGRLIVLIGVAPVKPAEFVIFRIAQWQGGSAVTE